MGGREASINPYHDATLAHLYEVLRCLHAKYQASLEVVLGDVVAGIQEEIGVAEARAVLAVGVLQQLDKLQLAPGGSVPCLEKSCTSTVALNSDEDFLFEPAGAKLAVREAESRIKAHQHTHKA